MKGITALCAVTIATLLSAAVPSPAKVEVSAQRTLELERTPLDVAISLNGKWIFVLTDQQKILVFSVDGKLNDEIPVDKSVDGIRVEGRGDVIFLTSRSNRTVQMLTLDFIHEISEAGRPFKGRNDAPVVVAVFSEFQ
jgi:hypothetical protein